MSHKSEHDDCDYNPVPKKRRDESSNNDNEDNDSSGLSFTLSHENSDTSEQQQQSIKEDSHQDPTYNEDDDDESGDADDDSYNPETDTNVIQEELEENALEENSNFVDLSDSELDETLGAILPKAASKTIGGQNRLYDEDDTIEKDVEDYREAMVMKPDSDPLPMWTLPSGVFIAEAFSPLFKQCCQFLLAIAEPISRCDIIHHYRLTSYSLYAAVSVGCKTEEILNTMNKFSKNYIPEDVNGFVRECTQRYGKIKVVLRGSLYFIESEHDDIMGDLLQDSVIKQCIDLNTSAYQLDEFQKTSTDLNAIKENVNAIQMDENSLDEESGAPEVNCLRAVIKQDKIELVQKRVLELDYPLLSEYEFRNDTTLADINISLKSRASLREYQREGLSKMLSGSRARSGIIVLPCGAGKTLVGVAAACTINKRCKEKRQLLYQSSI
ncbi:hypothetical protein ACOME3_006115 [Neoechinorhynchus agilis]